MVDFGVLMNEKGNVPVAVCFKDDLEKIEEIIKAVGGTLKYYDVQFLLLGKGSLLAASAKEIEEREMEEESTQQQPPGMVPGGEEYF